AQGVQRFQAILDLMRYASSETSALIGKASMHGVDLFRPRACFCLSSIGVAAVEEADVNRLSILTLLKDTRPDREGRFRAHQEQVRALRTLNSVPSLQARAVSLLPVIRTNAEVFAAAGSKYFGARRAGDHIGALLAGAFSLTSDKKIHEADAG